MGIGRGCQGELGGGQWLLMIICSLLEHPASAFISRPSAWDPMQQPVQTLLQAAKHIVTVETSGKYTHPCILRAPCTSQSVLAAQWSTSPILLIYFSSWGIFLVVFLYLVHLYLHFVCALTLNFNTVPATSSVDSVKIKTKKLVWSSNHWEYVFVVIFFLMPLIII